MFVNEGGGRLFPSGGLAGDVAQKGDDAERVGVARAGTSPARAMGRAGPSARPCSLRVHGCGAAVSEHLVKHAAGGRRLVRNATGQCLARCMLRRLGSKGGASDAPNNGQSAGQQNRSGGTSGGSRGEAGELGADLDETSMRGLGTRGGASRDWIGRRARVEPQLHLLKYIRGTTGPLEGRLRGASRWNVTARMRIGTRLAQQGCNESR
ncbi:unnamed protein product [Lampetra planeri]